MISREPKDETTLAAIAEHPDSKSALLFAVIIDISEPSKNDENSSYLTKLKVIDPGFNFKAVLKLPDLKFHKFVHISVYSETPEDAPRIKFVGDIIRLRRFMFKYSDRGELKGIELQRSNWLVYGGQKKDGEGPLCFKSQFGKNRGRGLNGFESIRLEYLRTWAEQFFSLHSLRYISWWTALELPASSSDSVNKTGVDLIIRCTKVDLVRNTLEFADAKGTVYELVMNTTPGLKVGQVIKLSCVDVSNDAHNLMRISLTLHSSCLLIPHSFRDFLSFKKTEEPAPQEAAPEYLSLYSIEPSESRKKPRVTSAVKKHLAQLPMTPVAELLKVLQNPTDFIGQTFQVLAQVTGFITLDISAILKRISLADNKVCELTDKPSSDQKSRIVVNLVMLLRDESVKNDQHLQVYILTSENDLNMFEEWKLLPPLDNHAEWNDISSLKTAEFVKKLNALKKSDNKVQLALNLNVSKSGKHFFKVVDSIFLNF